MEHFTRRHFIGWGLAGAAVALSGACGGASGRLVAEEGIGRLRTRPGKPTKPARKGLHDLGLVKGGKDGVLRVPRTYRPESPVPLIVMLHGAYGRRDWYDGFSKRAAEEGIAMVMPDSRGETWDLLLGGFGPDVAFLDRALAHTFERVAVDPRRIALAGFSDGASYALSVGLANGDLFTHVMALSPGFMKPPSRVGAPRLYVTHGNRDQILPVASSRDRIVPQLKALGYDVTYKEFDGGHTLDPSEGREAFHWLTAAGRHHPKT